MKILLFLLLVIISEFGQCQSSYEVSYSAEVLIVVDTIQGPSNFKETMKSSFNKASLLPYKLKIYNNNKSSIFYQDITNDRSLSKLDITLLNIFLDTKGYYYNNNGLLIHSYNIVEKKLNVVVPNAIDWTFTNDTKMVLNYKCHKSIGTVNKDKSVVAWFTKELPYYLGPKFFYGLPGLILEINEGNTIVLKATEIKTYNKKIKIPEFEKLLSARQADSILALANKKAEALLDN